MCATFFCTLMCLFLITYSQGQNYSFPLWNQSCFSMEMTVTRNLWTAKKKNLHSARSKYFTDFYFFFNHVSPEVLDDFRCTFGSLSYWKTGLLPVWQQIPLLFLRVMIWPHALKRCSLHLKQQSSLATLYCHHRASPWGSCFLWLKRSPFLHPKKAASMCPNMVSWDQRTDFQSSSPCFRLSNFSLDFIDPTARTFKRIISRTGWEENNAGWANRANGDLIVSHRDQGSRWTQFTNNHPWRNFRILVKVVHHFPLKVQEVLHFWPTATCSWHNLSVSITSEILQVGTESTGLPGIWPVRKPNSFIRGFADTSFSPLSSPSYSSRSRRDHHWFQPVSICFLLNWQDHSLEFPVMFSLLIFFSVFSSPSS